VFNPTISDRKDLFWFETYSNRVEIKNEKGEEVKYNLVAFESNE
jgi:hypothetical protein